MRDIANLVDRKIKLTANGNLRWPAKAGARKSTPITIWLLFPAFILFLVGILTPSMVVNQFGTVCRLSLLGGIQILWTTGHIFLATLIFLFTILFPPIKLALTGAAAIQSFPLTWSTRRRVRNIVESIGRWSLLDVLVIAILIVTIKVNGLVSVKAAWGIYAFAGSIVLSMFATHLLQSEFSNVGVPLLDRDTRGERKFFESTRRLPPKAWEAVGLALAISGAGWFILAPTGTVGQIYVTRKETLINLPRLFGNPSFYIQVRTLEGGQRLDTKPRTPIGNGLMWRLDRPVRLANVYEVEIFEAGFFSDKLVDRVAINGRRAIGQRFQFELKGCKDWQRPVAVITLAVGMAFITYFRCIDRKAP